MIAADSLVLMLRKHHRMPAAQLLAALGVSRPTLMRAVRAAGASVLTIGRARRTSYAARRLLRGSEAPLPVFRVDPRGGSEQAGQLHLAHLDGCVLEYDDAFEWPLDTDMRDGWFEGIPYPMQDLRPEGFLGRAFARENAAVLQVSEDPRNWSDDDALYALSLLGADLSGNFIIGEAAYRRWLAQLQRPLEIVTDASPNSRGSSRRLPASTEPPGGPSSKSCASTATVRAAGRPSVHGLRSTTTGSA
jgi:AraC-like DNA-binding protein